MKFFVVVLCQITVVIRARQESKKNRRICRQRLRHEMLLSGVKERSYKQRLVTRCDEIVGGGVRRLGENSVAPPIPLVGARARIPARHARLWCSRMAPTVPRRAGNRGK